MNPDNIYSIEFDFIGFDQEELENTSRSMIMVSCSNLLMKKTSCKQVVANYFNQIPRKSKAVAKPQIGR